MGEALHPILLLCLQRRFSHSQGRTQTAFICLTPLLPYGLEAISGTHLCLSPFPHLCTTLLMFTLLRCTMYSSSESRPALSNPLVALRSSWQNLTCFLSLILPGQRQVSSSDLHVSYLYNSALSFSPAQKIFFFSLLTNHLQAGWKVTALIWQCLVLARYQTAQVWGSAHST